MFEFLQRFFNIYTVKEQIFTEELNGMMIGFVVQIKFYNFDFRKFSNSFLSGNKYTIKKCLMMQNHKNYLMISELLDELSVAAYFVSISVNPIVYLSRHKDLRRYACKVQRFLQELLRFLHVHVRVHIYFISTKIQLLR